MIHHTIQGQLTGEGLKMAIVVSRFNELISSKLLEGCLDTLARHGVLRQDMAVFWTPGAFEISYTATRLMALNHFDSIICLGAVIRGATPHFDYVCSEAGKGIGKLNQQGLIPVIFGILTTNTLEQALERAGIKGGNKGSDAAAAAIEMANLSRAISHFDMPIAEPKPSRKRPLKPGR
jgi:6,7-dimethyl-8-ribityllumazine synthase